MIFFFEITYRRDRALLRRELLRCRLSEAPHHLRGAGVVDQALRVKPRNHARNERVVERLAAEPGALFALRSKCGVDPELDVHLVNLSGGELAKKFPHRNVSRVATLEFNHFEL